MRVRRQEEESLDIQMAPLIDIVFLLLIFFLVATTFKVAQEQGQEEAPQLPIQLPSSAAAIEAPRDVETLVVGIDRNGRKYFDGAAVSTGELHRRLRAAARRQPRPRVRIDADRDTRYAEIVEVIELSEFEGLRDVGLHTRNTEGYPKITPPP